MTTATVDQDNPGHLVESAQKALIAGQRDNAYSLAQQALATGALQGADRVSAAIVLAMAWLAKRDALRAESAVTHALRRSSHAPPEVLGFLAVEVVHAVLADPAAPDGPSPVADLARRTWILLVDPARKTLRQSWLQFIFYYVGVMLRNGVPRFAVAAARRAWDVAMEDGGGAPEDTTALLSVWAEAERAASLDGQQAKLGEVLQAIEKVLALGSRGEDESRFDLTLLAADFAFLLRRPPAVVAAWLEVAWSLASMCVQKVRVLSRWATMAVRSPAHEREFTNRLTAVAPSSLDETLLDEGLLIARAAMTIGVRSSAEAWVAALEQHSASIDRPLALDLGTLRAELLFSHGSVSDVFSRASALFDVLKTVPSEDARDPHIAESMGRLAYILVLGQLDVALTLPPAGRPDAVKSALFALEQARALRIGWAAHREDTRLEHGAIGLPCVERSHELSQELRFPKGVLAFAFLWDNRRPRLGVFVVDGDSVDFHWLRIPSGCRSLIEAARILARLGPEKNRTAMEGDLRTLLSAASEALDARFDDAPELYLRALARRRQPSRIQVVPHGPLVGLPLHVALLRAMPGHATLAISYSPTLFARRREAKDPQRPVPTRNAIVCSHPDKALVGDALAALLRDHGRAVIVAPAPRQIDELWACAAREILIVGHGIAVGDAGTGDDDRRASTAGSCIDLGLTRITTHDILVRRDIPWATAFLCICSGARHIDAIETEHGDRRTFQLAFLDDPTAGVAGALLASGVGQVIAFPFPVDLAASVAFFTMLFGLARAERIEGERIDWAASIAEAQDNLGARESSSSLLMMAAQHWYWPQDDAAIRG